MTFAQLRALLSVVETGGFTRAATLAGTSQPAVSHAVASLERELGAKLLTRRQGHVEPTALGREVAGLARTILANADEIRQHAAAEGRSIVGTVQLASRPDIATCLLPLALELTAERHPGIEITVLEGDTDEIPGWLTDSVIDVAFLTLLPALEEIEHELLGDEEYVALVPATHPFADRAALTLEQLASEPFIVALGCEPYIADLFAGAGHTQRSTYRIRRPMVIAKLVAQGLGVSIVPGLSTRALEDDVVAVPLDPRALAGLAAFWPERRRTAAARAVVAAVRDVLTCPLGVSGREQGPPRSQRRR